MMRKLLLLLGLALLGCNDPTASEATATVDGRWVGSAPTASGSSVGFDVTLTTSPGGLQARGDLIYGGADRIRIAMQARYSHPNFTLEADLGTLVWRVAARRESPDRMRGTLCGFTDGACRDITLTRQ